MSDPNIPTSPFQNGRFMYIIGVFILVGVGIYFTFMAVDGLWLERRSGPATVIGKEYRGPGRTYNRVIIDNRLYAFPQATSERYGLMLDIGGRPAVGLATKELYESVREGDQVQVTYRSRRITGMLQVVEVRR